MFKIGIVGAGIIGKSHSKAIHNNPDCCLVAVCDTNLEKAQEVCNDHKGAVCFEDYTDMADKVELDAVILNLPHFLHCEVTVFFLERGINVLVEKPMALNTKECDTMIAAAKKSGAKLAVGHVQRYFSAYDEVRTLIQSGEIGKLCMITEVRNVNYLRESRPKWFLDKKLSGGGILMNYGAHTLDKIMYVTGETVSEAYSLIDNPLSKDDIEINAQILLKLTGNISANMTFCGCEGPSFYETVFYFTNGVVKIIDGYKMSLFDKDGNLSELEGTGDILSKQIDELVKLLKGEESKIVTPEYGREIIRVLEMLV